MATWDTVIETVVAKLNGRATELNKEVSRVRISVAALVHMYAEGKQYLMHDADWRRLETEALLAGYALVRYGVKHVGFIEIASVAKWPRLSVLDHESAAGEEQD